MTSDFGLRMPGYLERLQLALDHRMPAPDTDPVRLHTAMRYACEGGKRLRGLLVYAAGETLGLEARQLDAPACAVELIHAYSLVHDDLPAMDDDDLRRGRPTVHKAWDEPTGILVGDALQALAFEVLCADDGVTPSPRQAQMVRLLALASGSLGMVGGQAVDIESEGQRIPLERLQSLHARKTGALILACLQLAAAAANAEREQTAALEHYGRCIGLAFQIQDDVLDVTADSATLGKTAGKDLLQEKSTYPALLGLDEARQLAVQKFDEACDALSMFGEAAAPLVWLARHIQHRGH